MTPPGFHIGPLTITYYGIILMSGALAAAFLAEWLARRKGLSSESVWDGFMWLLIGGIIGARLWHVLTPPPSMMIPDPVTGKLINPYFIHGVPQILDILNLPRGGLGIPGALMGGSLALYLFCRRKGLSFAMWGDIAAPAVALGQTIGRWGNFVNQELYGARTTLPWGIYIKAEGDYFHPLFLYESLWNLLNMIFLLWLGRRFAERLQAGDIMLTYLVTYPVGRFFLEFLRLDAAQVVGININQTLALVVAILAGAALAWRHLRRPNSVAEAGETQPSQEQ